MTVRWKPLLVLSGLFLVIAVVGVIAMVYALVPRGANDILPMARAERDGKHYERALIHYKRALQKDGKNAAIYEEMAAMYSAWIPQAPPEKKTELTTARNEALAAAAKHDPSAKEPPRLLLLDAMERDMPGDTVGWGKRVVSLAPTNADAHFALASEALDSFAPKVPDIKRDLEALKAAKAPPARVLWVEARLAQQTGDEPGMREALAQSRTQSLPADAGTVDRMALLRLRALDVQTTSETAPLPDRVRALQAEVKAILSGPALAPARTSRLSLLLERVQKSLTQLATNAKPEEQAALNALVDSVDTDVETLFQKALDPANQPELPVYLTYADHLRFRQKRSRCLEVVDQALKSKAATRPYTTDTINGLHAVAIQAALSDGEDQERFRRTEPHIKHLLESTQPRYQGLGHLFQGSIDLELSGVGAPGKKAEPPTTTMTPAQAKLRASALQHLKVAATLLPDVAETQARYGVALLLAQEQSLGRQYLQNALRLGGLDAQYQVWAAWSIAQAGYPEEAEPIVKQLLSQVQDGQAPRELEGMLHLLSGEIHQSRRGPDELKHALDDYQKSMAAGQASSPALRLRLAQIDVQLGHFDRALERIEQLRKEGIGGPAAEHLAVLTLLEQNKGEVAWSVLEHARLRYQDSDQLVGLEAAMRVRADKPKDADRVLAKFLARNPDHIGITLMRADLLANSLQEPDEARKLLATAAERSDNSGPMVQLAVLEMKLHDRDAATATIAKIRNRWKEAAVADLLDAQLALDQGDSSAALANFDAALKKDPANKVIQFYKAQLESRNGSTASATETLEAIAKQKPTKEIDTGLSLMAAAQSSLADIALANNDFDGAIHRLEDLKNGGLMGGLTRPGRWQLVTAYAAKGQWPAAKREIASIINDPKSPPTNDERVRAANLYRLNQEEDPAYAQLNYVLNVDPSHTAAAVTKAYMLAASKQVPPAMTLLRATINAPRKQKPPAVLYLMTAALDTLNASDKESLKRALTTIDQGLDAQPDASELVNARYRILQMLEDDKAAVAYIESKAKAGTSPLYRRMLVEVYRNHSDYAGAARVLQSILSENPKDAPAAGEMVRILLLEATAASSAGKRDVERSSLEKCAGLIKDYRARFPSDVRFLQAECELATRRGDLARAKTITQEMDKISKGSSAGALARAQLFAAQGRTREAAEAYEEALERNPRQIDVRLLYGMARLKLGETDEALRQARLVLEADKTHHEALLLQARATAAEPGSENQIVANRTAAIDQLTRALRDDPKFVAAYHLKSELQMLINKRDGAVATLKEGLKAVPDDATGLATLIQRLTEARDGAPASPEELAKAREVASTAGDQDAKGHLMLAIAVGYHKANQLDLALPWAQKAATKLDAPLVHLNYGDLLLSIADEASDKSKAKEFFQKAVEQYDQVLKVQANAIEAVNNKAWILHTQLDQSRAALELTQGLLTRVDRAMLPAEFFDTLGDIQQTLGKTTDAEESYNEGLRKSPDHPVLNYHMGKLLAADKQRSNKATPYLERAIAGRAHLSPAMANDLGSLSQTFRGN